MKLRVCFSLLALIVVPQGSNASDSSSENRAASLQEAVASKSDVWAETAIAQPNGPSYEFFEKLLPPPRYVNADFRFYPIVLSAPNTKTKARLISNGSGVNVRGGTRAWHDMGTAAIFRVGPDELRFGEFLDRLQQPTLAEGYLPIPEIRYAHDTQVYKLEAFCATEPELAEHAIVFVKFSLASGINNLITVQLDTKGQVRFENDKAIDEDGQIVAYFDKDWTWDRGMAHAKIGTNKIATVAIATQPLPPTENFSCGPGSYDQHRKFCVDSWNKILGRGMSVEVPEPYVNHAWCHLLIQNFMLMHDNSMRYSSGNQYDQLYEAEGSDATLGMMLWGYEDEARKLIPTQLHFTRKNLEFHQAGHKIDDICRFYWQTRDEISVKAMRPAWQKEVERIVVSRTNEYGLFPKEQYCGDIATPVYSLNSNAKCWAALRDLVPVLKEIGDNAEAERIAKVTAEFKKNILAALDKSIRYEVDPPFVPIALFGDEQVHDPITHTRIGGYWNLMANYIIGTRLLDGDRDVWLPHYLENHGGLCMGLTRSGGEPKTFWTGIPRTNPLYGLRYAIDCLRRDDVDRGLANFYGMLAHGFTRNTFIGAEGCSLTPLDGGGRMFYCPPNSASNAEWLWMLRHLVVQDFDMDADGTPETLRLMFATPKAWLADGKQIKVERAPTVFGPVSMNVQSKLSKGEVIAEVDLPKRNQPKQILLRARVPDGWKVISASAGNNKLQVDEKGSVDLTKLKGKVSVRFQVNKI